jgi:hypothetical protein
MALPFAENLVLLPEPEDLQLIQLCRRLVASPETLADLSRVSASAPLTFS